MRKQALLRAYGALSWITAPALFGYMLARSVRDPGWRSRLPQRWGFRTPPAPEGALWLHASSLGESQALSILAEALGRLRPDLPQLLTAFTPAGLASIQQEQSESRFHCFLPLDFGPANHRFLRAARPSLGIILETEIWPGLYAACGAAGVPLVVASARLSRRSHARYRRVRGLMAAALKQVRVVGAQTEEDAQRFRDIGPKKLDVRVTGNLKLNYRLSDEALKQGAEIRRRIGAGRPVWVAASTHEPEEHVMLMAHRHLMAQRKDALLILAPRHKERFAVVRNLLEQTELKFGFRSSDGQPPAGAQVFVLDTLGELNTFYAAADLAFVGGSIARVGGHNLAEPATLGLPVITGPHLFHTRDMARILSDAGALFTISEAGELAGELARLFEDEQARKTAGAAGKACLEAQQGGVLERTLGLIEPLLPPRRPAPSSG